MNVVSREVLTKRRNFLKDQQQGKDLSWRRFRGLRTKADCSWTQEDARLCRSRMRTKVHVADYLY